MRRERRGIVRVARSHREPVGEMKLEPLTEQDGVHCHQTEVSGRRWER